MRILITGGAGRLGSELARGLSAAGHEVVALPRTKLDVRDAQQVEDTVARVDPDVIANCSAYNAVDAAETDPGTAFAVNAEGPAHLAEQARARGALLVHYSTDFVFDGGASVPYREDDAANPLSVYGKSKLAGEGYASTAPRHYILRVESLFGGCGANGQASVIDRIATTMASGRGVRAFVDRTVSPSYVPDIVAATCELLERQAPPGLYHCVNSGHTTWFELAEEIASCLGVEASIEGTLAAEIQTPAPRPRFCALSNSKLAALGIAMPSWQSALARHFGAGLARMSPVGARVAVR